jgi:hypothetical protein
VTRAVRRGGLQTRPFQQLSPALSSGLLGVRHLQTLRDHPQAAKPLPSPPHLTDWGRTTRRMARNSFLLISQPSGRIESRLDCTGRFCKGLSVVSKASKAPEGSGAGVRLKGACSKAESLKQGKSPASHDQGPVNRLVDHANGRTTHRMLATGSCAGPRLGSSPRKRCRSSKAARACGAPDVKFSYCRRGDGWVGVDWGCGGGVRSALNRGWGLGVPTGEGGMVVQGGELQGGGVALQ